MPCVFVPERDDTVRANDSNSGLVRIEYLINGDGKIIVVLVPGMCVPSSMYDATADALKQDGRYTCIQIENRGMKGSGVSTSDTWSAARLARDAWAVVDAVRKSREDALTRVCLVGHSMGGMIVQRMAALRTMEVGCLICISTHTGGLWNLFPTATLLRALIRLCVKRFQPRAKAAFALGLHYTDKFLDAAARRTEFMARYLEGSTNDYVRHGEENAEVRSGGLDPAQSGEIAFRGHLAVVRRHSLTKSDAAVIAECRRIFKVVIAGKSDCVIVPSSCRRLARAIDADICVEVGGAHFVVAEAEPVVIANVRMALNEAFGDFNESVGRVFSECNCSKCDPESEHQSSASDDAFRFC